MAQPRAILRIFPIVVVYLVLGNSPTPAARPDMHISLKVPKTAAFGDYQGSTRIRLGEVRDEGFAEPPTYLGMGPESAFSVHVKDGRTVSVETAATKLLGRLGILAEDESAGTYDLDIIIRRNHFNTLRVSGKYRLRGEVFLEFIFREAGTVTGKILACGNAEAVVSVARDTQIIDTYRAAFNDSFFKFFTSETTARHLGSGWKTGKTPEKKDSIEITRIDRGFVYGPTAFITKELDNADTPAEMNPHPRLLVLADFSIEENQYNYTEISDEEDEEFARTYVPDLVREHLNAYYPGAFPVIERRQDPDIPEELVVTGTLHRFKIGDYRKRSFPGFGAGKDLLDTSIQITNGSDDWEDFGFRSESANWGGGWQAKRGQIRDMADQLARDIAYLLVRAYLPGYRYPDDLEVSFDGKPYPL